MADERKVLQDHIDIRLERSDVKLILDAMKVAYDYLMATDPEGYADTVTKLGNAVRDQVFGGEEPGG